MNNLHPEFQTELARAILQDHSFLPKYRKLLNHVLFKEREESEFIKHALTYFDEFKCTPSRNILLDYVSGKGYDIETLSEDTEYLYKKKANDITYIAKSLKDFTKKSKIRDSLIESMKLLEKSNYGEIHKKIKEAVIDYEGYDDIGNLFWEEGENVLKRLGSQENFIPTGIYELDENMSGGAIRGTENVIVTPPNKGKTTVLVNIGKYAVLNGFKVVHYTLELSAEIIIRRYMMSMCRMTKKMLVEKKKTAYDEILRLSEEVQKESLIVKRYKSTTCTVQELYNHLNSIRDKVGFIPDMVIVDYGDLLKPSRTYAEKRHELSSIYAELRDMADEFNLVLWTATQTNRQGNQDELITINELAECFDKAAIADVIISVNQTLEEKRAGEARMFLAKNRDDESLISIPIETDWTKAHIGNCE